MEILMFEVNGQVIESKSGKPLTDLKVEAWDKDVKYNDLLGQTFTNDEGRFDLSFDSTYFREHAPDSRPDLLFKVFLGKRLLKSTEDEVLYNAGLKTEVTIKINMPGNRPEGKDRITAAKAFKIVDFLQQSEFKGLYSQFREKSSTSFGFLSDMLINSVTKFDFNPIKVGDNKNEEIVGKEVIQAKTHLESQQVEVNEVKQYEPMLNSESLSEFTSFPIKLKAGQKINLYEENGKVRYYSVVKDANPINTVTEPTKDQNAEVLKLREELKATRMEATKKDKMITKLQNDMSSLQKNQSEINSLLKSEPFIKLINKPK